MSLDWMRRALCAEFLTMPWVQEPDQRSVSAERAIGVVCVACPVNGQCAAYVVSHAVSSGFWAGVDRTPSAAVKDGAA